MDSRSLQQKTHCKLIKEAGIEAEKVNKLSEGRPNILDLITNGNIDIIVNSPVGKDSVNDDSYLRKRCDQSEDSILYNNRSSQSSS